MIIKITQIVHKVNQAVAQVVVLQHHKVNIILKNNYPWIKWKISLKNMLKIQKVVSHQKI